MMTATACLLAPLIRDTTYPIPNWYPFVPDTIEVTVFIWLSQSIGVYQCGFGCSVDLIMVTMFWHLTVQFELLEVKIESATTVQQLEYCVKQHQHLLL